MSCINVCFAQALSNIYGCNYFKDYGLERVFLVLTWFTD